MTKIIYKGATFSRRRTWRYTLERVWDWTIPRAMFIGLNPSTATEIEDDPTVRRCMGYARDWGFGGLYMTNLFAFRATDPRVMKAASWPVGPSNDYWLRTMAFHSGIIVAAWGNHGTFQNRSQEVVKMISNLMCLGVNRTGEPKHPLYLPKNTEVIPYVAPHPDVL